MSYIVPLNEVAINEDLFGDFLRFLDVSKKSIATYKTALRQFANYIRENSIKTPSRSDILAFKDKLMVTHKATTIQLYIVAIRLFFRWAQQKNIYTNIADNIKGVKISKFHKKDCLTSSQMKTVIDGIDDDSIQGARNKAIITLMVACGLRTIEVSRADVEDIQTVGDCTVLFIQGKGKTEKNEYVKIPQGVENNIRHYLMLSRKKQGPLFTSTSNNSINNRLNIRSISKIVKESLKKAGFNSDRLTAHSLRHTSATLNLLNGGTLEETQQLLRHTNINTTMIYLHHLTRENNNSENRIAKAIGI